MEKDSTQMRAMVRAVGGPLREGENRKAWIFRVATAVGSSYRVIAAAFYGEQMSLETKNKLALKAGHDESTTLATQLEYLVGTLSLRKDCDVETIDALRRASRKLRGLGRAATAVLMLLAVASRLLC